MTVKHASTTGDFRLRGKEMTRLETFTDAAFAFSVTLLVVGGGDAIPQDFAELTLALKQVPAFAASFANIMVFWWAHHRWSRRFGLEDAGATCLSLLLVFVVLIYVYPLKAVYSGAFAWASDGFLTSYFSLQNIGELRGIFIVFGSGYAAMAASVLLLNRYALGKADELALTPLERFETGTTIGRWLIQTSVAVTSVVLSMVLPDRWVVLAGFIYASFGILEPWHGMRRERLRAALIQSEPQ